MNSSNSTVRLLNPTLVAPMIEVTSKQNWKHSKKLILPEFLKIIISSDQIKLIYSEKATKIWRNLSQGLDVATYLKVTSKPQGKCAPNFCGLLRKPEL